MADEHLLDQLHLPKASLTINGLSYLLQVQVRSLGADDLQRIWRGKPSIMPNVHFSPIPSEPLCTHLNGLPSWQETSPHVRRLFFPNCASINVHLAKYLALNTLWRRESGVWMIHQPCFARSARLKPFKSLKPILSSDLGKQMFSQAVHAIFLSLFF